MNPALSNVQVPSSVAASVQQRLMTENEAKINPVVKKHFTGTALSTVDSKIKDLLDEFSFDDETKTSILTEQSTYNRIPMLAKAIADAKDRSISATGGEKKALIASNIGPYTIDLKHCLDNGNFVDGNAILVNETRNHSDWAKFIEKLVKNPNLIKDMGERLYESVKDKYDLNTVTKDRKDFYKDITSKS